MSIQDEPETREGQRIAKVMARAGLCSRRDAERWIAEGRVLVNGEVLASPAYNVSQADDVIVDGLPLRAAERTRLFFFHKPKGLVTTAHDPEGRPTIFDALPEELPRVVTVGRLDINTEGLLLLTNDGGLARVLELPATGWLRRYRVRAHGDINQEQLDALRDGIAIDGVEYRGIEAKFERQQGTNVWLTMGLREGKNREIKRVLEHLGMSVNRLIRVSFGPFELGDLPEGEVTEVRTRVLRDQLGPKLAKQANVDFDAIPEGPLRAPDVGELPPARRRDDSSEGPPRKRKHVSVLRAEAREGGAGPRKRITRSATADRKGREIQVEHVSLARPPAAEPPRRAPAGRRAPGERSRRGPGEDRAVGAARAERPSRSEGSSRERPPGAERVRGARAAGDRPERRPRSDHASGEKPARSGGGDSRAPREGRGFGDRPERRPRSDRASSDRPARSGGGDGRAPREGRSFGDRPERRPRSDPASSERPARFGGGDSRTPREGRSFGDRPERRPRSDQASSDRPARSGGGDSRAPREGRGFGDRPERRPRSDRASSDRPARSGGGDGRAPREGRSFGDRPERRPRSEPASSDRPARSGGGDSRAPREGRSFGDRPERRPRSDGPPRTSADGSPRARSGDGPARGPRPGGGAPGRGPRAPGGGKSGGKSGGPRRPRG